jgi:hypothetical protein
MEGGSSFLQYCAAPGEPVAVDAIKPPPSGTTDQQQYEACMNAHGWKLQQ